MANCVLAVNCLTWYYMYSFISGQDQVENSLSLTDSELHWTESNKAASVSCTGGQVQAREKAEQEIHGSLYMLLQRAFVIRGKQKVTGLRQTLPHRVSISVFSSCKSPAKASTLFERKVSIKWQAYSIESIYNHWRETGSFTGWFSACPVQDIKQVWWIVLWKCPFFFADNEGSRDN